MNDLKLLIVEDDSFHQVVYIEAFQNAGCHLTFCSTAALAVNLASSIEPDIIYMDLDLPDGDGVQVIDEIRRQKTGGTQRVVVVTASTDEAEHQRAMDAGADSVLVKPVSQAQLLATLSYS